MNAENYIKKDGYLFDQTTGERAVFYVCDPALNLDCDKKMCRHRDEIGVGFCSTTPDRQYQKAGTKPFYKVLKEDTYYGREYIEG